MKKLTTSLLVTLMLTGTMFAGPAKDFKAPVAVPCFLDQEFSLDLFYSYNDALHEGSRTRTTDRFSGRGPCGCMFDATVTESKQQYFRDGSGGGLGVNYFFARYFGIGLEGNWWVGVNEGSTVTTTYVRRTDGATKKETVTTRGRDAAQQLSGSIIFRYPFEGVCCWAPYVFTGGGVVFDGSTTGFAHVGLGAEFRITPHIGVFADWRWEFMDDRNDVNMTRTGVRFVF